jgi:hypothetical protein
LLLAIILPKTIARLFLAGRSFGKGDLRKAYKTSREGISYRYQKGSN